MKRRSCVLLLVAAALSFVLPVAPVAAQTTTTDTENQSGATLVLRGQGFIQQLIGQYGASAKVVDVARSLLSQLGAQYQRALLDADLRVVAIEIAKIDKQRQDLADLLPLIDEEIANLDPASPTYAADLASLNASRSLDVGQHRADRYGAAAAAGGAAVGTQRRGRAVAACGFALHAAESRRLGGRAGEDLAGEPGRDAGRFRQCRRHPDRRRPRRTRCRQLGRWVLPDPRPWAAMPSSTPRTPAS